MSEIPGHLPYLERSAESCHKIMMAALKARSNSIEALGDDEIAQEMLREQSRWLGDPRFFEMLERLADRGPEPVEWMNLASILQREQGIAICLASQWGREMAPPELAIVA